MSKVNHYFTPPLQDALCTLTSRCQYFTFWYIGLHDRQTKGNNTPKDIMKYIILIKIMFSFNYIFPITQCAAQELFAFATLFYTFVRVRWEFSSNQAIILWESTDRFALKKWGKGWVGAYFSFRKQEAEEDAQERRRGGPKCPPGIIGALSSFERRQEKKTSRWSKMPFHLLEEWLTYDPRIWIFPQGIFSLLRRVDGVSI